MIVYEVLKSAIEWAVPRKSEVVKVCKTRKAARRIADKLDQEYGATVHWIRETKYFS